MIKKNAEVDQQVERIYIVSDYGGWVYESDRLHVARSVLSKMPQGRMGCITAKTVTTTTIKTEHVIQTKR